MKANRFLALCAMFAAIVAASIVSGCGGDDGSGVTEDTLVGTDNGADSDPCPSSLPRKADGMCPPEEDTVVSPDDNTTNPDVAETEEDVCSPYKKHSGALLDCDFGGELCTLDYAVKDWGDVPNSCVAVCHGEFGELAEKVQWDDNGFYAPSVDVRCDFVEEN
jgi:hypothetical protein